MLGGLTKWGNEMGVLMWMDVGGYSEKPSGLTKSTEHPGRKHVESLLGGY